MASRNWQLIVKTPLLTVGVCCDETALFFVSYLPAATAEIKPQNMLAAECEKQLLAYVKNPRRHRFDLPLMPAKTPHQRRVRAVVQTVAGGETITYGGVAARLKHSSPRAVGGACRANAVPLIVPCHRVVAAGGLGGFMGGDGKPQLSVKTRLLAHEGAL